VPSLLTLEKWGRLPACGGLVARLCARRDTRFYPGLVYGCLAVYAALTASTAWRHEPWADEAQAWLLARDSTLTALWTRLLHYEGTPGLWHTILNVAAHLGYPYRALNLLPAALGCIGTWMILRYSPLPVWLRMLLPFTFFLGYQYAVIARSYSLLPPLLFISAALLTHCADPAAISSARWLAALSAVLALTAAVSVHGAALSVVISLYAAASIAPAWHSLKPAARRRVLLAGLAYSGVLVCAILAAWPTGDIAFPFRVDITPGRIIRVDALMFREAFAGNGLITAAAIALSVPLLWRGRGLPLFLLTSIALCAVSGILYWQPWTQGLLFLCWLLAIWISAARVEPGWAALAGLSVVIAFQLYWEFRSIQYDWNSAYSGSLETARVIETQQLAPVRIAGLGYSTSAIQPYFSSNVFVNFDNSYWDWSRSNNSQDPVRFYSSGRPGYAIAGFKTTAERKSWAKILDPAGYDLTRTFEGGVYWKDRVTESESFDVYRRAREPEPPAASAFTMADNAAAKQLLAGFYGLEANSWRWTARRFSVLLKIPEGARENGAELRLKGTIPSAQFARLGPMTLTAAANGRPLPARTFSGAGAFEYACRVPPIVFRIRALPVEFVFDKALEASNTDARELAAIVASVNLSVEPAR
jgi:hypothetical protein